MLPRKPSWRSGERDELRHADDSATEWCIPHRDRAEEAVRMIRGAGFAGQIVL